MKILVAVAAYPTLDGNKALYFVHSRNLYYQSEGIDVTVLNFRARKNYVIDNIKVISFKEYKKLSHKFDILILHAVNIRNHYKFLKEYGKEFQKKIFIFHGHEILHVNKYYPKSYNYRKNNIIKKVIRNYYDDIKLYLWRRYFLKNICHIRLIFVSNWLYKKFLIELNLEENQIKFHTEIISNSVGEYFEKNQYNLQNKEYDFITIRSNYDQSTYCIDLVTKLAEKYPLYKFCIIGNGHYFDHNKKPSNVILINGTFNHVKLGEYLNKSQYALFLTRHDTQGVMACEVASFGIPLITSDIEICREIFKGCPNVVLISNEKLDLDRCINTLENFKNLDCERWDRYFAKNTINKEIEYIKKYYDED